MTAADLPLFRALTAHGKRLALVTDQGDCTYAELLRAAEQAACVLLDGRGDLQGEAVAFMAPSTRSYVVTLLAIWRAGGMAVPLCIQHPAPELQHVIGDSRARTVIASPEYAELLAPLAAEAEARLLRTEDLACAAGDATLPAVPADRNALLIYTSGTTGKPKGAISTHDVLAAQLDSVTRAWEYSADDRSLLVLPLHHLHGILNILLGTLWAGGTCEMVRGFSADHVWDRIAARDGLTLFMAVPTIYAKLIAAYDGGSAERKNAIELGCRALRLMVSGSAALPVQTLERFRTISGHTLLERYGMTELGMVLGNPLHGPRLPGHVGIPFPGVELRLVNEHEQPVPEGTPGQIQVRGPGVFKGYFGRPEATAKSFTGDGWFITGDEAVCEDGSYRILGRSSVDILKTGGFKVSALEIEAVLREHPAIADCAVVGLPDPEWGQRVAAAAILRAGHALTLDELRTFGKERLAAYKVPTRLRCVTDLPRNALGKVVKPKVATLFEQRET